MIFKGRDNTLRVWDLQTGKCEKTLKGHSLPVWAIIEIEPSRVLATGSSDFTIKIWDMEIGRSM